MKKYILILFLVLLGISCETQYNTENPKDNSLEKSIKQTETRFSQAIHGIPLVIPLPEESDPTLFLMPVSNDKTDLSVDRIYLVDCLQEEFVFERDIYKINYIERINETEESSVKYIAVVSSIENGSLYEYEIDAFTYHQIRKINSNTWEYKSNITIPIIKAKDRLQ